MYILLCMMAVSVVSCPRSVLIPSSSFVAIVHTFVPSCGRILDPVVLFFSVLNITFEAILRGLGPDELTVL